MNYFAEGMVYLEQWDLKSKSQFFWYFEVHLMMAINRDEQTWVHYFEKVINYHYQLLSLRSN